MNHIRGHLEGPAIGFSKALADNDEKLISSNGRATKSGTYYRDSSDEMKDVSAA